MTDETLTLHKVLLFLLSNAPSKCFFALAAVSFNLTEIVLYPCMHDNRAIICTCRESHSLSQQVFQQMNRHFFRSRVHDDATAYRSKQGLLLSAERYVRKLLESFRDFVNLAADSTRV